MNLIPLFDRVIIKEVPPKQDKGAILLPSSVQEKQQVGKVLAVGNGLQADGKTIEMQVKVGDVVAYPKFAGSEFKVGDEKVTVLKQTDILCIVKNKEK